MTAGLFVEVRREVPHGGVSGVNEIEFLVATPALDLLLAGDGVANVGERFEVDQAEMIFSRCCWTRRSRKLVTPV